MLEPFVVLEIDGGTSGEVVGSNTLTAGLRVDQLRLSWVVTRSTGSEIVGELRSSARGKLGVCGSMREPFGA